MSESIKVDIKRDFKGITCKGYYLSEKYDGVQGVWDGKKMLTRTGKPMNIPQWWLRHLPTVPMIGELWIGRGTFERMSGIARGHYDSEWQDVRYMVFKGCLDVDVGKYGQHITKRRVLSEDFAHRMYTRIIELKGEGIMLDQRFEPYKIIKIKPTYDIDAKVYGYLPGKGRNEGRVGALLAYERDGRKVKVGSGLSDAVRSNPPAIGSIIKVSYTGRTKFGVPRFARFVGVRAEKEFV